MRLRGEAGNEVTQQQRNVEEMLERAARTEQRDAAQELADKTQARPNVAQTPRRMMAGIACTLVGGVLWGVNGSVSKILMEQYDASPMWVACVREIFAGGSFAGMRIPGFPAMGGAGASAFGFIVFGCMMALFNFLVQKWNARAKRAEKTLPLAREESPAEVTKC